MDNGITVSMKFFETAFKAFCLFLRCKAIKFVWLLKVTRLLTKSGFALFRIICPKRIALYNQNYRYLKFSDMHTDDTQQSWQTALAVIRTRYCRIRIRRIMPLPISTRYTSALLEQEWNMCSSGSRIFRTCSLLVCLLPSLWRLLITAVNLNKSPHYSRHNGQS